jgi:hypothetical protein
MRKEAIEWERRKRVEENGFRYVGNNQEEIEFW